MNRRRHGFTLIELLVAIGIIIILVGILFIGMRVLEKSAKQGTTRITLENYQSMLTEFELAVKGKPQPREIWRNGSGVLCIPVGTADFWSDIVDSPKVVTENSPEDRFTSDAVLNTGILAGMLNRIPANKTEIAKLPPTQLILLVTDGPWSDAGVNYIAGNLVGRKVGGEILFYACILDHTSTSGNGPPDATYWVLYNLTVPETVWTDASKNYSTGDRVSRSGNSYICIQTHVSTPANGPPNTTNWASAPVNAAGLLDGWNNPIIFVPSEGLRIYDPVTNNTIKTIAAPDNRPFFASAGPDGMFQAVSNEPIAADREEAVLAGADDNLYSFEN